MQIKHIFHASISLVITSVFLWVLSKQLTVGGLFSKFASLDTTKLLLYVLISILAAVFRAARYQSMLNVDQETKRKLSFYNSFLITCVRNALIDFFPARIGELSYFYLFSRVAVKPLRLATSFAFCTILDVLVLLFLLFVTGLLVSGLFSGGINLGDSTGVDCRGLSCLSLEAVAIVILFIGMILLLNYPASVLRLFNVVLGVQSRAYKLLKALTDDVEYLRYSGRLLQFVLLTFGLRICKYAGLLVLFEAVVLPFGVSINNPFAIILAFIGAEAAASLPVGGIMGFGAYEGTWDFILKVSGIELDNSLSLVFIIHLITQINGYSLGLVSFWVFMWKNRHHNKG